ncbi:WxL protein peptidoglycan domain-containing protein [Streptomyces sp. SudanB182_2057]|uniref:WxL protein peptidoglycan domain-containing protein n=1 Tax=Streptomyces sp. SudanB182_2057 TaxID=3035281 RepID=UPI003F548D3E
MRKPYALLLAALLPLWPAAPARAADNGSWSVYPVASEPAARPYFTLSADPGRTLADEVAVHNRTSRPLTFRLYAADAYNTARDGGFAVRTAGERMRGVGAWAGLARTRITVPGHGTVTVPFTLRVPEGAEPGDHPGAIVALDERTGTGGGDLALGVRRAVGARVYLRVGGPRLPALSVGQVRVGRHRPSPPGLGAGTATVSYTLRNTGNVTLSPRVKLTARGLFGRTLLDRGLTRVPAELLPGQRVRLTETWRGLPRFDRGEVTVTASARGARESASAGFLVLPWLLVALVFAAAALTGALLVRARRARARRSAPGRPSRRERPRPFRRRSSRSGRP